MTPITEAQLKALGLPDTVYQQIVDILEEALTAQTRKSRVDPVLFERFWSQYPKRDGTNPKAPARLRFESHVSKGVDPEAIISGAKAYRASLGQNDGTCFVCQAVTWLNQRRWEDYSSVGPLYDWPAIETNVDPLWSRARAILVDAIGPVVFGSWFGTSRLIEIDAEQIRVKLSTDSEFKRHYIEMKFYQKVLQSWKTVIPTVSVVDFVIEKRPT